MLLRRSTLLGLLILASYLLTLAASADSQTESGGTAHLLVGLKPQTGFEVTCDDSLITLEPMTSDALGILGFTVDRGDMPDAGTVCLRIPGPPVIIDPETCVVRDSSAVICCSTDRLSTSRVEYGTVSGWYTFETPETPTLSLEHWVPLDGLESDCVYYYRIISTSAFGSTTVSNEQTMSTCPPRPTLGNVEVEDITATSTTVRWTTSSPTTSRVEYGPAEGYDFDTIVVSDLVEEHELTLSDLLPETVYVVRVSGADECGSEVSSGNVAFTTAPDIFEITGVSISDITPSTATIRWWTTTPATTRLRYGTTSSYGLEIDLGSELTTGHLVVLSGLTSETRYHFEAISEDLDGRTASSGDMTFTTASEEDPDQLFIYNVSVNVTDGPVARIRWFTNMPSNSTVEYGPTEDYGRTVVDEQPVVQHNVELTDLDPQMLYHFRVTSSAGPGLSSTSNDLVFSTQGVADLSPPMSPVGLVAVPASNAVDVAWEASQAGDLDGYTLYRRREGELLLEALATLDASETSYLDDSVNAGVFYDYAVTARDAAGNESCLSEIVRVMAGVGAEGKLWVYPNPMVDETSMRFVLPGGARGGTSYSLQIYDAAGRLVRTVDHGSASTESTTVTWDAKDDRGKRVASGTYFCVLNSSGGSIHSKLTVLK